MAAIGAAARGFVYVVSVTGTTGERSALAADVADVVARARGATPTVPLARRLRHRHARAGRGGRRTPAPTASSWEPALVRAAAESDDPPRAVRELVTELSGALER